MSDRMNALGSASVSTLRMPGWVRGAVFTVVGLAVAAGLYLLAVRGDALLADLSSIAMLICG